MEQSAVELHHRSKRRIAETCRALDNRLEDRPDVSRRVADDAQHLTGDCLLPAGFRQFPLDLLDLSAKVVFHAWGQRAGWHDDGQSFESNQNCPSVGMPVPWKVGSA